MQKIILLTCFLSFKVFALSNSIIAVVNDDIITISSINKYIKPNDNKTQKLIVVNQQINKILQLQEAQKLGVVPNSAIVNQMLNNVAKNNQITPKQLQAMPEFNEIVANIGEFSTIEQLKQLTFKDVNLIPSKAEIALALKDNPSATKALNKQIKIAQIVIKNESGKSILIKLIDKINQGESFSALAKLHSHDPSYKNGGQSNWIDTAKLPKVFTRQLNNLSIGDVSIPFQTKQGWRIVKIIDKRNVDAHLIKIQSELTYNKKQVFFNNWIKKLREGSHIKIFEHKL